MTTVASNNWIKKGLVFDPATSGNEWLVSHASVPFVDHVRDDIFRVYFSGRNNNNKTQGAYVDVHVSNGAISVQDVGKDPVLPLGDLGCFDDSAAWPSAIVTKGAQKYMYYLGWNAGRTVPFYASIGLAISDDGKHFERISKAPIMGRTDKEPHLCASSYVMVEDGLWRMWYLSGVRWEMDGDKPKHYYHIKYAESDDGITWRREGTVCIDFKSDDEFAIARPCVVKDGDIYKMWYCYRGDYYKIGYAESSDGITWQRKDDEITLDVSPEGWDSQMICYPFVFSHKGYTYLLYNGNDYGRTGFGYAVLEQ